MNPTIVKAIILFICLLVFILQIVALAHDEAYVKWDGNTVVSNVFVITVQEYRCGMFECNNFASWNLREYPINGLEDEDEQTNIIKASCAFGVMTCILMFFQFVIHALLLPASTLGKMMMNKAVSTLVRFFWVFHLITVIFLIITWALLAAYYDKFVDFDSSSLQHGFVFLIINTVFELVLVLVCFKHLHSEGPMKLTKNVPPPPPAYPPQHYQHGSPNPIDKEVCGIFFLFFFFFEKRLESGAFGKPKWKI